LESINLRPGKPWAALAGASEFGGGALTALGLGGPLGPIALQGAMATAARTVHRDKPIWNSEGGAELPALFSATGLALALAGPGRYSLDRAFDVQVSKQLVALTAAGVVAGIALADRTTAPAPSQEATPEVSTAEARSDGEDQVLSTEAASTDPDRQAFASNNDRALTEERQDLIETRDLS
jgi:putative oxidoreductase